MANVSRFLKRNNELWGSGSGKINLIESRYPNCQAPLTFDGSLTTVTCNYCGTTFIVDDLASTTDRILRAQSDAKGRDLRAQSEARARDMQTQLEYEREHLKYDPTERNKERAWANSRMALKALIVMVIIGAIGIYSLTSWINGRMAEIDERNNTYVEQAHEYIKQGDYDSALLVANRIDGDRSLSSDQDDRWDTQRKELIKIIKERQKAEG